MAAPYHATTIGHYNSSKPIPLSPEATGLGVTEDCLRREQPGDYLSGLDWSEGDVRTNVRTVVDGLMKTSSADIHCTKMRVGGEKQSHDPRVTMEMRHREVGQSLDLVSRRSTCEARVHDDVIFYCGGRRHKAKQSSLCQEGPRTIPVYILSRTCLLGAFTSCWL